MPDSAYLNIGGFDYKPMKMYYVTPLELVAIALKAGMKAWTKAQEDGKARLDPEVLAVWMGVEIRCCLPRDLNAVADMRPDEGWMIEAGIEPTRPKWLNKAKAYVKEAQNVEHLDDGLMV